MAASDKVQFVVGIRFYLYEQLKTKTCAYEKRNNIFIFLYYCDNFACEDCTLGDLYKYTHYIQIHNHGFLIRWFLKVSIEVIPLMWLGRLFHRLQACGPKESL